MSEENEKSMQEVLTNGLRKLLGRDFILLGLLTIGTTIVVFKGKDALAQQVDAGVQPVKTDLAVVKEEQKRQADETERVKNKQAAFEIKVDKRFDEQGADIRALYKAIMTGQKQDRLEKPLPSDGGQ